MKKYICILVLMIMIATPAFSQEEKPLQQELTLSPALMAGDSESLWLALPRIVKGRQGFQICRQKLVDNEFMMGFWHPGKPTAAVVSNNNLKLYFNLGGAQYYSLYGTNDGQFIPVKTSLINAYSQNDKTHRNVYALVRATEDIAKPIGPAIADSKNENQAKGYTKGQLLLIRSHDQSRWKLVTDQLNVLEDKGDAKIKILAANDLIYFFVIEYGQVNVCQYNLTTNTLSDFQTMQLTFNITNLWPMVVNQQIRIALQYNSTNKNIFNYCISWQQKDQWLHSDHLQFDKENLVMPSDNVSFTEFGQSIAMLSYVNNEEIIIAQYDTKGQLLKTTTAQQVGLSFEDSQTVTYIQFIEIALSLFLLLSIVIAWFNRTKLNVDIELPPIVRPAPVVRRIIAIIFDFSIIMVLSQLLFEGLVNSSSPEVQEFVSQDILFTQIQMNTVPPALLRYLYFYALFTVAVTFLYYVIMETAFTFTPGKYALGLAVVAIDGQKPTLKQILIRNVFRAIALILLLWPLTVFLALAVCSIIFLTKYNRSLGDLFGRTMIILRPMIIRQKIDHTIDD
ncbi:MAG: RDD family protein [Phycisphaerae bacterium]|nr:RDD family protein [Phycisphaerae bacterium]